MSNSSVDAYNDIIIDGWHFRPTADSLAQFQAVDRFPGKITVGDYSLDSNDLLSAWVISDLTGGHGVADLKEGVDDNRYRFGDIYTRYPQQFCKPFQIANTSAGSGSFFPLGDILHGSNISFIASSGTDLYDDLTDTTNNLTGSPASKGVAFRGAGTLTMFYIPMGNNGYATYDPVTPGFGNHNAVGDADNFQAFCVWDNKLIGITNGGQLYYATTTPAGAGTATTFTSYGSDGKLDSGIEPKALHVFYNRAGEPAVHIVTNSGVWVFDAATPRIYQIPDFETQHPYMGIASCVWRGNLYVSAGLTVLRYNGNVVDPIGLDRDDGLPYLYQGASATYANTGYIRDLTPGLNGVYALVRGLFSTPTYYTSVHEWSGFGWHCLWAGSSTRGAVRAHVSKANSQYRLYWGLSDAGLYFYQTLPVSFTNPREAIDASGFNFGADQTTYYLETGRFDANMPGYRKIANAVEVDVRTCPADTTITIKYRIDQDTSWTTLGSITTTGHSTLQFGTLSADGIYPGVAWEKIEFRMEFTELLASQYTAVVDSLVFSFLKLQNPSIAYTMDLDLTTEHMGKSPKQMLDKLMALRTDDVFFALKHRGDTYRIRIAGVSGREEYGLSDSRGIYSVSILEIPTRLGVAS